MERKRNPGLRCQLEGLRYAAWPTPDFIRASVTGLEESIPFRVIHSPDTCFCTGSAQGRRLMGYVEDRSANLRMRGRMPHPGWRPDLIHRPGGGTSLRGRPGAVARPRTLVISPAYAAAAMVLALAASLKGFASASMRC